MATDAIILAAGRGARLGALTAEIPKCLLPLTESTSILDAQLSALSAAGYIRSVAIAVGYRAESVRAHLADRVPPLPVRVIDIPRYAALNNAHTALMMLEAREHGRGVLQINGDAVFDPAMLIAARASVHDCPPDEALVFVVQGNLAEEEMKVHVDQNRVVSLLKNADPATAVGEAFGISYFGPDFIERLMPTLAAVIAHNPQSYFEDGINEAIALGAIARTYVLSVGSAMEVDFPADLVAARALAAQRKRPSA